MKLKTIFYIGILAICSLSAWGQAKKPTLMVVPSDAWCKEHGFEQALIHRVLFRVHISV